MQNSLLPAVWTLMCVHNV